MAKHRQLASVVFESTLGHASAKAIWRTVVVAGAMLGAPACGPKPQPAQPKPAPTAPADPTVGSAAPAGSDATAADPAKKPPADDSDSEDDNAARPRGNDGPRPTGRGFVLS